MKNKPRKHDPRWKDTTVAKRQSKRREQLDMKAKAVGYPSWSAYETAVINGETRLTKRAADALPCGHNAGIEFGESSWLCVVCGQPVRR